MLKNMKKERILSHRVDNYTGFMGLKKGGVVPKLLKDFNKKPITK